jgi:hypothetical protein
MTIEGGVQMATRYGSQPAPQRLNQATKVAIKEISKHASRTGHINLHSIANSPTIYVDDLTLPVLRFSDQIVTLNESFIPCPVVEYPNGKVAPLDIYTSALDEVSRNSSGTLSQEPIAHIPTLVSSAKATALSAGFSVYDLSPDDAQQHFEDRFDEFLTHRSESAAGLHSGTSGSTPGSPVLPGLNIVVNTNNYGLQVLFSPAFFLTIQTVFGNSRSSPVNGSINPGLYVFGAQGPNIPITFETNSQYKIPATTVMNMVTV